MGNDEKKPNPVVRAAPKPSDILNPLQFALLVRARKAGKELSAEDQDKALKTIAAVMDQNADLHVELQAQHQHTSVFHALLKRWPTLRMSQSEIEAAAQESIDGHVNIRYSKETSLGVDYLKIERQVVINPKAAPQN